MAALFVSYRKQGADKPLALHLAADLRAALGDDAVFIDEQTFALGRVSDFLTYEVIGCKAVIVVIGPTWLERVNDLSQPDDWVRREIEGGLRQGILMVPVLIDGARMPSKLPPQIAGLKDFGSVEIYGRFLEGQRRHLNRVAAGAEAWTDEKARQSECPESLG
jgi:hypothetical protein